MFYRMACAQLGSGVTPDAFEGVLAQLADSDEELVAVVREAIEELGYQFEETEFFYYILQYLRYVRFSPSVPFSPPLSKYPETRLTSNRTKSKSS